MADRLNLSEDAWRARLTAEQFQVLRRHGTERANTGCFVGTHDPGIYVCAGCHNPLFQAQTKFESGTGWPSFFAPLSPEALRLIDDNSLGMMRTEVRCARCDGHLGHVFPDGPPPHGQRYCMNSVAMLHVPEGETLALVVG